MIANNTKVVIIDDSLVDSTIYTVLNSAYDFNDDTLYYIIDGRKKITIKASQIREATQVEIENNIKFDPIAVKTVVAYVDLTKPNHLLEITEFNQATLAVKAMQCYTKVVYNLNITDLRPARNDEKEAGQRITIYNKDVFLSYMNPFMVTDLYNVNTSTALIYPDKLKTLGLIDNNTLTENGERLYDDIDFLYLSTNMYDFTQSNQLTTHIATDADGTVTEFKLSQGSLPNYDDINKKWFVIETATDKVISVNKVTGMVRFDQYADSLKTKP